jgi:hypothetical protein
MKTSRKRLYLLITFILLTVLIFALTSVALAGDGGAPTGCSAALGCSLNFNTLLETAAQSFGSSLF